MPYSFEVSKLLNITRSGIPIVAIETTEEKRTIGILRQLSNELKVPLQGWSVTEGLRRIDVDKAFTPAKESDDPEIALRLIKQTTRPTFFALFDMQYFLDESQIARRLLKEIAHKNGHEKQTHTLFLIGHKIELDADLRRFVARYQLPMPDPEQLEELIKKEAIAWSRVNKGKKVKTDNRTMKRLIENLKGINFGDARRLIKKVIWDDGCITENELPEVNKAKFELMDMEGVLSFQYETARFSEVGGLVHMKDWVKKREKAFFQFEQKSRLTPPKGMMLVGVQGGGKSLAAKAVAGLWGIPLLRLDFGALYNKYHGESERNLRSALQMAELMSPCVLWMDEIEKGVATNDSDGGTSRRMLGTLLTWMAEQTQAVFVVATSNDISSLPPELIRKGRLDEIFFVDLPEAEIREEIFNIHLNKRSLDPQDFDLKELATASSGFSGAEIEQSIISSLYQVERGEDVSQEILIDEINKTRPLSIVMAEQLEHLRAWAKERTVWAG